MKGLRITNYILSGISIAAEIVAMIFYFSTISSIIGGNAGEIFASVIALLPLFILITCGILVLAIANSIIYKIYKTKRINNGLMPTALDRIFMILPWAFIALNIICYIILFATSNSSSN